MVRNSLLPRLPNAPLQRGQPRVSLCQNAAQVTSRTLIGVNRDFARGRGEEIEETILRLD
jgi:hypothetical protein